MWEHLSVSRSENTEGVVCWYLGSPVPILCVWQSIPANGVGLKLLGLVFPGASTWIQRSGTGDTACLSSAAGGIHIQHVNICVFSLVYNHPAQPEGIRTRVLVLLVFCGSVVCVPSCMCVYVCVFVCAPARNVSSALLLAGPEAMEQQQPHLPWAVGSSMNGRFLLTALTVPL